MNWWGHQVNDFAEEVSRGGRFEFGRNWRAFLATVDEERIAEAGLSLRKMLGVGDLEGRSFLDVGSGSGLFSLAARRLGARVHSFDYDPQSVACARELKSKYLPGDQSWTVEQGSALDEKYLESLGEYDITYSWGVLHHTGDMWKALGNVCRTVKKDGKLFIAIYNDKGMRSRLWRRIKQAYCSGTAGRLAVCGIFLPYFFLRTCLACLAAGRNVFADYGRERGMSVFHDWSDWLGGYPYEYANAEEIVNFIEQRGYTLTRIKTTEYLGNNQFVFTRKVGK
ncbi:MAG: class I SAM-dependent methyltransferase [Candidatus Glassbacteria bacterium]|nr:class I SAM-dependent methyltransferase [Candidatus Glassbacteria bacterium]